MGGYGSGRWRWHQAKDTVEDTLTFSITTLSAHIKHALAGQPWSGRLRWSRLGQETGSIEYVVSYSPWVDKLSLNLRYDSKYRGETTQHNDLIELVSIPCHFGGRRWLAVCPRCGRRCKRLCLYGAVFVCRKCANLTYRSAQEAHKYDRFHAALAVDMGVSVREVTALMRMLG